MTINNFLTKTTRPFALIVRFGFALVLYAGLVEPAVAQDLDGDGWAVSDGDCCDDPATCPIPALVNPGAFEVPGNFVDDDCDVTTPDSAPLPICSNQAIFGAVTAGDLAEAMDLCQTTTANPPLASRKWGVIDAQFVTASGAAPSASQLTNMVNVQTAVLSDYGVNVAPQRGATMAGLASGAMRDANDPGFVSPNPGTDLGSIDLPPADFLAANGGALPNLPGCPTGSGANDSVNLRLQIRVPTNAVGFSYKYRFFSAEYGFGICLPPFSAQNDFHLGLLTSGATGLPVDGNIVRDSQNNPVGVNLVRFTTCLPQGGFDCPDGPAALEGTGMENGIGGGTDWLTVTAPVVPGETIVLELMVFDVEDNVVDSLALLDGFEWQADEAGEQSPPIAVDDSAATPANAPVTIDVAANDTDIDGNLAPASAALVSGPLNGTANNNGDGTFTYTPNASFSGVDIFTYEICDTTALCDTATVTITVSLTTAGCDSTVATIDGLKVVVDLLTTSHQTKNVLTSNLINVESALSNGNNKIARSRMTNFISRVVNRSNFKEINRHRILLNEASSLICGGANVLISIELP